jgi:hypothetical protein
MTLRVVTGELLACLALAALPPGAEAGRYHVYTCRTPSGEIAPVDGWSGSVAGAAVYAETTCPGGGALVAALRDATRTANTDIATWAFEAPTDATIAAATLWRAGDADGVAAAGATYALWFSGPNNANSPTPAYSFAQCESGLECPVGVGNTSQPMSAENRVVVPAANLGAHLYVDASCVGSNEFKCREGQHDPNGYAAVVYVYAADVVLEQSVGPTAGNVSGELASAPAVQGASDVAFSATDPGSGVYEAVFTVDGQVVQRTVVDQNGGRCRDVGQTADGVPAFLYVRPCLGSVSADVPFDTTRVGNGPHHLIVSVIDAAGNAATVLDRQVTVANPPRPGVPGPANGTGASAQARLSVSWKGTRRERITRPYGRSATADGLLTGPGGVPIAGAVIDLTATPSYVGGQPTLIQSPHTGRDGRFSVRIGRGASSRALHFAYRSHFGDALPAATRTLALEVQAGISLSVAPHTASVGRSIFFRGRLLGGPIPPGGKQLVLEARSPGSSWIEFQVVRTDARGRYHASYRFKFPGPARYEFRVRSEPESDFPFAAGSSNLVAVRER